MYVCICIIQSLLIYKVDITYIIVFTNSKGMEIEERCVSMCVLLLYLFIL